MKLQDIRIVPLPKDDFEKAMALIVRAFDETYEECARFEFGWSLTDDTSDYKPTSLAAYAGDVLAGIVQYGQNYAHIGAYSLGWVAVDPGFQNKGIGKKLVEHAEAHINEHRLHGQPGTILIVDTTRVERPDTDYYLRMGYIDGPLTHAGMHVMIKVLNKAQAA